MQSTPFTRKFQLSAFIMLLVVWLDVSGIAMLTGGEVMDGPVYLCYCNNAFVGGATAFLQGDQHLTDFRATVS